jgi:hypothetical protein
LELVDLLDLEPSVGVKLIFDLTSRDLSRPISMGDRDGISRHARTHALGIRRT